MLPGVADDAVDHAVEIREDELVGLAGVVREEIVGN